MPRAGDSPWTSLYRRSRRSYDRSVSDSRTCRRAPSLISAIARWIWRLSETMLLMRMTMLRSVSMGISPLGDFDLAWPSRYWRAGRRRQHRWRSTWRLRVAGQQVPDHVVVEAKSQDQLIAAGDLHQLRRRQLIDDRLRLLPKRPGGTGPAPCRRGSCAGLAPGRRGWLRGFPGAVVRCWRRWCSCLPPGGPDCPFRNSARLAWACLIPK